MKTPAVAIICGGGPAPGINTVLSTLAKLFIKKGFKVIGVHSACKGLFAADNQLIEFDFELVIN